MIAPSFMMSPNAYVCGMPENAMSHKLSNHPAWSLPRDVGSAFASHQEPIDQIVAKHKRCAEKGNVPQDMDQVDRVARESHGIAKHIRDGREHPKDARDHQHVAILF